MPKINREEYEVLKEALNEGYEWIARDSLNNSVFVYPGKPNKYITYWEDVEMVFEQFEQIDENLFQFIQWEDEEPYNIQELIEEYEDYADTAEHFSNAMRKIAKALGKAWRESEETEVKNIEWLKVEVHKELESWHGVEGGIDGNGINEIMLLIDQLDEPEVLSQEWIDDNKEMYLINDTSENAVPDYKLQNLLVPKQEITFEQAYYKIAESFPATAKEIKTVLEKYYSGMLIEFSEEITEEQVQKYLSEHGIEVVEKEPETVASVIADFYKSLERFKEVISMEVEELEE